MTNKTTFGKTYEMSKEDKLKKIGAQIRNRRKEIGMTQQELAVICGYNKRSMVNVEKGNYDLSISRLYQIAEALDVNLSYLLSLQELPSAGNDVVIDYANTYGGEAADIRTLCYQLNTAVEKASERKNELLELDQAQIKRKIKMRRTK